MVSNIKKKNNINMINKSYIYYGNVLFENSNYIDIYYIDFVFLLKLKNN